MFKDRLRDFLLKTATSANQTLGQMIFTVAGLLMLFASINRFPILFLITMVVACVLAWTFRDDLRSGGP